MNELTDRLADRLEEIADNAHARRDLDGVIAGRASGRQSATSRPARLRIAQIAAGAMVLAGIGALVAFGVVQESPAAQEPVGSEPAPVSQPAAPNSEAAEPLIAECLAVGGFDVQDDDLSAPSGEQAAREAAQNAARAAAQRACEEELVVAGKIAPPSSGPAPASTLVAGDSGPPSPVNPAESGVLRTSVDTEVGLFEIYDQIPSGDVCQSLTLDGGTTNACYDNNTVDDQMAWSRIITDDGQGLLYGFVDPNTEFSISVDDQVVLTDSSGVWFVVVPIDVRMATLNRADGPTTIEW